MAYHVVYSKSPYLLARLCIDLQMEGCGFYDEGDSDGDEYNPFADGGYLCQWLKIWPKEKKWIGFYNHSCDSTSPIRHTLTADNYLTVLENILND